MKAINGLLVWFVATCYVVYAFSLNTAAAVFLPSIKSSLALNSIQATMAVTMFIVGFALMQIPAGYLLDRYPARYVVSAGVLTLALGNLFITGATSLPLFALANFIQGAGASFAFVAAGILTGQWFKASLFPILFGLTQTMSCTLSGILHYYLSSALLTGTWESIYLHLFYAGMVLFALSLIIIRNPHADQHEQNGSLWSLLKQVCARPQLWIITIAVSTSFGVLLAYGSFWYIDIQTYYLVNSSDAMIIGASIFLGVGVGTPLLGYLSNVLASRKMVIHLSLSLGVMFLLAGIYLPHFHFDSLIPIKIVSFFIGFFLSGAMLFFTIINETFPQQTKGLALSVANTGVFLFNSLMLFIPYALTTSVIFFTSLWILPAIIMIAIMFLYFVNESNTTTRDV